MGRFIIKLFLFLVVSLFVGIVFVTFILLYQNKPIDEFISFITEEKVEYMTYSDFQQMSDALTPSKKINYLLKFIKGVKIKGDFSEKDDKLYKFYLGKQIEVGNYLHVLQVVSLDDTRMPLKDKVSINNILYPVFLESVISKVNNCKVNLDFSNDLNCLREVAVNCIELQKKYCNGEIKSFIKTFDYQALEEKQQFCQFVINIEQCSIKEESFEEESIF